MFTKVIEQQPIEDDSNVNYRETIKAVIVRKNKILLIHTNKGDYKFPGGGVENQESHSECLIREVEEETGYINCIMKEKLGSVVERKFDKFDNTALFQMTSHYYLCELINDEKIAPQLEDYESAQEFSPEWITLDAAIEQNETNMNSLEKNTWVEREIFVLKGLKNRLKL